MKLWVKIKEVGIDLFVALIFLLFFLLSSVQVASRRPVVLFLQEVSGVYEETDVGREAVDDLTAKTLAYLGGAKVELSYTTREKFHLGETRSLFLAARKSWFILVGLFLAVILLTRWEVLKWQGRINVITKGVAILFFAADLLILFFFLSFFKVFHETFFTPGTWQFGPQDLLTTLFPYRFWVVETAFVLSFSALLSTFFFFCFKRPFVSKKMTLLTFPFFC